MPVTVRSHFESGERYIYRRTCEYARRGTHEERFSEASGCEDLHGLSEYIMLKVLTDAEIKIDSGACSTIKADSREWNQGSRQTRRKKDRQVDKQAVLTNTRL